MIFESLHIENFGTIKAVDLPLKDLGLVLVTGNNQDSSKADSNGAGKSLLLDAFCWCVWGKPVREYRDDEVINKQVGKNCRVTLNFVENSKPIKIIRYRKHDESKKPNDLELWISDIEHSGASIRDTQSRIDGLIGVSYTSFCAMMLGSGVVPAQLTDSAIKDLLEDILQTNILPKVRDRAGKKIKDLETDMKEVTLKQELLSSKLEGMQKNLNNLENLYNTFLEKKKVKLKTLSDKLSDVEKEKAKYIQTLESYNNIESELEKFKLSVQALDNSLSELSGPLQEIKHYKEQLFNKHDKDKDLIEAKLKDVEGYLAQLKEAEQGCSFCGQSLSKEKAKSLWDKYNTELSRLSDRKTDLETKFKKEYQSYTTEESQVEKQIRQIQQEKKRKENSIYQFQQQYSKYEFTAYQIKVCEKEQASIEKEILEVENDHPPQQGMLEELRAEIQNAELEQYALVSEYDKLNKIKKMLSFWYDSFSPQGIRSYILENITPILNTYVQEYCSVLTNNEMQIEFTTKTKLKKGDTREKFSILTKQLHGGNTYQSNSKGERQRANLAIAFALSDLAELHSSKKIPFRFLDEPFEGIDAAGMDSVVSLLLDQAKKYSTVFVVTHQNHLKELFPKEIQVIKEKGFSRLCQK